MVIDFDLHFGVSLNRSAVSLDVNGVKSKILVIVCGINRILAMIKGGRMDSREATIGFIGTGFKGLAFIVVIMVILALILKEVLGMTDSYGIMAWLEQSVTQLKIWELILIIWVLADR